eukprot:10044410-Lingulodinium_polyedra.AAC.1
MSRWLFAVHARRCAATAPNPLLHRSSRCTTLGTLGVRTVSIRTWWPLALRPCWHYSYGVVVGLTTV